MGATRVAITVFFLADGLAVGSWAARIPAVQEQADLTNGELGVALFAMALGALVSMPPQGGCRTSRNRARHRRGAARPRRLARPRFVRRRSRTRSPPCSSSSARASARQRRGERAGHRARAALRALHPVVVPRRVQCRRASSAPASARPRPASTSACGRISACSPSRSSSSYWSRASAAATRGTGRVAVAGARPATSVPCSCSGRRRSSPCSRRAPRPTGAPSTSTDSVGTTAAVAALGYTGFSLGMVLSRAAGDRLGERFGPVALARGGGLSPRRGSRSRSSSARRRPRSPASPRWERASASSSPFCSAPGARRRACPRAPASPPCRRSAGSDSSPGRP